VVEKTIVKGQRVMAGDVLYRLANLGTVWLDGEVFEQDLPDCGSARKSPPNSPPPRCHPPRTHQLHLSHPQHRNAYCAYPRGTRESGFELKPGMFATIRFTSLSRRALTVPRSSVLATGERNMVFVRDADGRFVARDIVIGKSSADRVEVLRGLAAGETVVASGTFLVDAESNLDKALADG